MLASLNAPPHDPRMTAPDMASRGRRPRRLLAWLTIALAVAAAVAGGIAFWLLRSGTVLAPPVPPRLNAFRILGPGGGGGQFIPTISPHDPRKVFVACDMTGGYVTLDGGENWRMFNLRTSPLSFVFDPVDPRTIYAVAVGLMRSTDDGQSWELVYPNSDSVTGLSLDGDHASDIVNVDGGPSPSPTAFAIDPTEPKFLVLALGDQEMTRIMESTDAGKTWREASEIRMSVQRIFLSRNKVGSRSITVAGPKGTGVHRDGKWTMHPLPGGVASLADISVGKRPNEDHPTLYAVGERPGGEAQVVVMSSDSGASWIDLTSRIIALWPSSKLDPKFPAIATSLNHPDIVYVSFANVVIGKTEKFGVIKSINGGGTWDAVREDSEKSAPAVKDVWTEAVFDASWAGTPLGLGVSPNDPNLCYATDLGRTLRTNDGGKTWVGVYSKEIARGVYATTGLDVTTSYGVHVDPFDAQRLFISYTDIGLFRSDDGGKGWVASSSGIPQAWRNTTYWVALDPQAKGLMWAATSGTHDLPRPRIWRRRPISGFHGGVCVSKNGGRSWRPSSDGIPDSAVTHVMIDLASAPSSRTLYATSFGHGVYKSLDGGRTWTNKTAGMDGREPLSWRLVADSRGVLYQIVARRREDGGFGGDGDGALYRSMDGAERWEKIALPPGVNGPTGLAVDPVDTKRLYLSAWGWGMPAKDVIGGVFVSEDEGATWTHVLKEGGYVYDVTMDPRNSSILYASGFESSAFRSEDRGMTWRRLRGYNFKWGHRVIPDSREADRVFITTFGGSVWVGPAVGDLEGPEDINVPPLQLWR